MAEFVLCVFDYQGQPKQGPAGDYRRKVQLARLCAWGVEDMVVEPALGEEIVGS